ncbi:esterase-like activity of phytase family protein [Neptuniibacter sp. QD37_11]|uniref:esterase-like activity of phytase family protein n=1 Tax=Neptuniibacter sp. QD37_11 TaxID=3398209 RepID=UPI0039F54D37
MKYKNKVLKAALLATLSLTESVHAFDYNLFTVVSDEALEPSGLCHDGNSMYTVSDDHNNIYKLEINSISRKATALKAYELASAPSAPTDHLPTLYKINYLFKDLLNLPAFDWEGIECDDENFWLASEATRSVLHIERKTWKMTWQTITNAHVREKSLHNQVNAGIEGIATNNRGELSVAFEREPSGILEVDSGRLLRYRPHHSGVPDDISAIAYGHDNCLYFVNRNRRQMCKLLSGKGAALLCLDYSPIAKRHFDFKDKKYGIVEGLTVHHGTMWLITDNNQQFNEWNKSAAPLLIQINGKNFLHE